MKHEPHDFEAPTRQAKIKEWLATLRGPGKPKPAPYVFGAKGTDDLIFVDSVIGFPAGSMLRLYPSPYSTP